MNQSALMQDPAPPLTRLGKIITIGNSKGGVGKTTSSCILAWLLAKNYRVLAVDMDVQADMTKLLLDRSPADFEHSSVYDAIIKCDARPFIQKAPGERDLFVLPANENLALYDARNESDYFKLSLMLETVRSDFDYIFIDTPPTLSTWVISSIMASDFIVGMVQTHRFAVDQIETYMKNIKDIRKFKPSIKFAGMAIAMFEKTKRSKEIKDALISTYPDLVFKTTITKRSKLMDMTITGLSDKRAADRKALENYIELAKEIDHYVRNQ